MYSMWKYHNEALKNPSYQLEGLMDCFREEQSFYMPRSIEDTHTQKDEHPEPEWNKRQWDTIKQLKAQVVFLSSKVNQMRANASKRETYTIK